MFGLGNDKMTAFGFLVTPILKIIDRTSVETKTVRKSRIYGELPIVKEETSGMSWQTSSFDNAHQGTSLYI